MRLRCALPVLASLALWARLQQPSETIDLGPYLARAPILLRAEILSVSPPPRFHEAYVATARLRVTRWYRGTPPPAVELRFAMQGLRMINGHDCFDFPLGTHWFILAKERDGALELIDDCYGAFRVSPELGAVHPDPISQLEADFVAGLSSPYPSHRIINLQRLANLQKTTSLPVLRKVIATGRPVEKGWAVYAALRAGDLSTLTAIPALLEIANDSTPPIQESARTAVDNMRANEGSP